MTKKVPAYINKACKDLNKTVEQYLKDTDSNYVIVYEYNGKRYPVTFKDDYPVIYGDEDEARYDMQEGDEIITEKEYLKEFCNFNII